MTYEIKQAEFNPTPESEGFTLWEHWETLGDGKKYLLDVSSNTRLMVLKPGDYIVQRTWAPAGKAQPHNRARTPGEM